MSATKMGFLRVDFTNLVETARTGNWDAARLAQCFNDMPEEVAQDLLDFKAEIDEHGVITRTGEFTVCAGKWEQDGHETVRNYKVIDHANTLDDAIALAAALNDYPWCFIEYGRHRLVLESHNAENNE